MMVAVLLSLMLQGPNPAVPAADPPAPEGWGGFATGSAQLGAGIVACVACSPLLLFPGVGTCLHSGLVAAAAGVAVPVVGDWLGQKRGALAWPFLTAIGTGTVVGLISLGTSIGVTAAAVTESIDPDVGAAVLLFGVPAIALVGGALIALLPMVVYQFASVDKDPSDHGEGFPGLFSPAEPTATQNAPPAAPAPEPAPTPEPVTEEPAAPEVGPSVGY